MLSTHQSRPIRVLTENERLRFEHLLKLHLNHSDAYRAPGVWIRLSGNLEEDRLIYSVTRILLKLLVVDYEGEAVVVRCEDQDWLVWASRQPKGFVYLSITKNVTRESNE